jgi:hypothetical protein
VRGIVRESLQEARWFLTKVVIHPDAKQARGVKVLIYFRSATALAFNGLQPG